jgi:molybdenum cofactor biosynthesis enzyme MoaA
MMDTRAAFATAIEEGRMGDRLWLYATYHCNLACVYCLTESSPRIVDRRAMTPEAMIDAVREAREIGLSCVGVTGGETFMLP